ncbi:MAG: hypothetical protein HRT38_02645 [Alteromonadaceae bacterium]|nr:hypothetical protein [Alteromonadaceae bacterium]
MLWKSPDKYRYLGVLLKSSYATVSSQSIGLITVPNDLVVTPHPSFIKSAIMLVSPN